MRPLSGDVNAAIGSNIFGAILDEMNFMARSSNRRAPSTGACSTRPSRCTTRSSAAASRASWQPGVDCLAWCAWFVQEVPGRVHRPKADRSRAEIERSGKTGIYVYDRTLWQIKPNGTYGEKRFRLFLGDETRKPRILAEGEVAPKDAALVMDVPEEFRSEFTRDILSAIRDIAGSATFALHPFIVDTETVASAFDQRQSVLSVEDHRLRHVATQHLSGSDRQA